MDYLLKDSTELSGDNDAGYYVSKERAESFLRSFRKSATYHLFGFGFINGALKSYSSRKKVHFFLQANGY